MVKLKEVLDMFKNKIDILEEKIDKKNQETHLIISKDIDELKELGIEKFSNKLSKLNDIFLEKKILVSTKEQLEELYNEIQKEYALQTFIDDRNEKIKEVIEDKKYEEKFFLNSRFIEKIFDSNVSSSVRKFLKDLGIYYIDDEESRIVGKGVIKNIRELFRKSRKYEDESDYLIDFLELWLRYELKSISTVRFDFGLCLNGFYETKEDALNLAKNIKYRIGKDINNVRDTERKIYKKMLKAFSKKEYYDLDFLLELDSIVNELREGDKVKLSVFLKNRIHKFEPRLDDNIVDFGKNNDYATISKKKLYSDDDFSNYLKTVSFPVYYYEFEEDKSNSNWESWMFRKER